MATMAIRISACPCDSPFFLVVLADADFVIVFLRSPDIIDTPLTVVYLVNLSMNDNTIIPIVHGLRNFEKSGYERSVQDTAKPRGCVPGGASCAVIVI